MSNLLKEAIADAKTVRETAIANAKMALEEAFTPHLKSMLSAKLAEDEVEEGFEDEITAEEMDDEEDEYMEEMMHDKNRREYDDEEMEEGEHDEDDDEDIDEGIIEINGVKYAPITEEDEDEDMEEGMHDKNRREDDDEEMEEDLDLEAVIKELETEIAEAEESDEDSVNEAGHEDDEKDEVDEEIVVEEDEDDDEDKMDEQSKSSGIGAGDNKVNMASAGDEEDPGKGKEMKESVNAMQKELNEYKEAVTFLREKLHEVNILNAKLLYTNRLFKEYVLSNDQKMKVVETFDRAQTTREIKLVYSTLAESFNDRGEINKKRGVKESASRKTNTTKPQTKIISEEDNVANRFKKLAGILKD